MLQRTVRLQGVVSLNRVLLDLIEYSSSFTGFFLCIILRFSQILLRVYLVLPDLYSDPRDLVLHLLGSSFT